MPEAPTDRHRTMLLQYFAEGKDQKRPPKELEKQFGPGTPRYPKIDLDEVARDQLFADLIAEGFVYNSGGDKKALHPRPRATYRLTSKGKDQAKQQTRPPRPNHHEQTLLEAQEAFILLQVFRAEGRSLTRSDLNGKLKTKAALENLEFKPKEEPTTIAYHLALLVEKETLAEQRSGSSVKYTLTEDGVRALGTAKQHDGASFTLKGEALNALLAAARKTVPISTNRKEFESDDVTESDQQTGDHRTVAHPTDLAKTEAASQVDESAILSLVDELKAGEYEGQELIPIHVLRRLVAERHGPDAASHASFDRVLKRLRSDDRLRLTAIDDLRGALQQELDDSLPGMNETIFYIVVE